MRVYGDPVVTMRLPREMIAAVKMAAARHNMTMSELIRESIADQLERDGIIWQTVETMPGQMSLDEAINA